jgi:glucokinase
MFDSHTPRLLADIGGTNARFALFDGSRIYDEIILACADYPSLADAIEHYLSTLGSQRPRAAAIAVATPVDHDQVKLTNHVWSFSISATRHRLNLDFLKVINDFTALALSLPQLPADQLRRIGDGEAQSGTPLALIGPGTGLGVSGLIPTDAGWLPLQSEGGHVTYGAANPRETEILALIGRRFNHVSAERLLSGSGLLNLYQAIAGLEGSRIEALSPADITERGLNGSCRLCAEVLQTFCGMLGTAAGNLVLTLGAQGGVYIGGGIVPRLGDYFEHSPFRQRFEHRGRFSGYLKAVPSHVIMAKTPALLGAAQAFDDLYDTVGVTSRRQD